MNPCEKFYIKLHYHHKKTYSGTKHRRRKPDISADILLSYYVMPEHNLNLYACLPTYFPPLSTANTFKPTGCSKYWRVMNLYLTIAYICYDISTTLLLFGHGLQRLLRM
jgi:hypothetical protein